jgi:hypothetical protein
LCLLLQKATDTNWNELPETFSIMQQFWIVHYFISILAGHVSAWWMRLIFPGMDAKEFVILKGQKRKINEKTQARLHLAELTTAMFAFLLSSELSHLFSPVI